MLTLLTSIGTVPAAGAQHYSATPSSKQLAESASVADSARRDSVFAKILGQFSSTTMVWLMIPEYHDEQRFRVTATTFGPMVNAFASPFLNQFTDPWQIQEQGSPGIFAAWLWVAAPAGSILPSTYTALGLVPGINCLYLNLDAAGVWTARMIAPVAPDTVCRRSTPGTSLVVDPKTHPLHLRHADYPPVVRFGETGLTTTVGVKCLNAWCEVGPAGFVSAPPLPPGTSKTTRIKGWHDQQYLATLSGGTLTPTGIQAAIAPEIGLEQRPASFYSGAAFRQVGELFISGTVPPGSKYARWGLKNGRHRLALRHYGGKWEMEVTQAGPGGISTIWNATREIHFDAVPPGTGRFRLISLDDGVWVPCGTACCRADGDQ